MDTTPNVAPAAPAESAPATENVTPASTDGQAPTAPEAPAAPNPEKSRAAKRIDDLTRLRYEAERRAEAAEAKAAAIERQTQRSQQFSQLDSEAPDVNKFDSLHSYNMAMADWTTKRAAAVANAHWEERMEKEQAKQAEFSQQAMQQRERVMRENMVLEEKMAGGAKKYADFQQAIMNPELPSVRGTPLMSIVLEAEHAADIAYSLAKNPSELERLLSLPPVTAAREVFRLDAKFAGSAATSAAPSPPPPRNGSAVVSKDWNDMSTREHAKAYWARKR